MIELIRRFPAGLLLFCSVISGAGSLPEGLDCVEPGIGTDGQGGMIPYIGVPFASAAWSPMTRESQFGRVAYDCNDEKLLGFISTRQMAIAMGEWGEFSFLPSIGEGVPDSDFRTRGLQIDHRETCFRPYYCSITAGGVKTEFTALAHSAIYKITFPANSTPRIVFDASRKDMFLRFPATATNQPGGVSVAADGRFLAAWNTDRTDWYRSRPLPNFKARFRMEFSSAPASFGRYGEDPDACGAYFVFPRTAKETVLYVRCGVSLIDDEQCAENLQKEIPDWDFDAAVETVRSEWRKKFDALKFGFADQGDKDVFATAIYHSLQWPRDITEYGRHYSAYDDKIHEGVGYTGFSTWDTYRAENALLAFLAPERMDGMMQSLVNMSKEGGWLPLYPNPGETSCMAGAPAEIMLAEAYLKGFRGFDAEAAYAAVRHDATVPSPSDAASRWRDQEWWRGSPEGRGGLTAYQELGYVACDRTCQSVSRTQDFALADSAVARFAAALGKKQDAEFFASRSRCWTNLWNAAALNVAPRDSSGEWVDAKSLSPDNPYDGAYSECSPELARWSVPHDVPRLTQLLGGRSEALARLREFVRKAYDGYWGGVHSNEPSHHIPYLFNCLGEHDDCAETVRMIMKKCYRPFPYSEAEVKDAGLHGHDDCGQLSAWYVFSALGFYPVDPASLEYRIGSPLVENAELDVGGGRKFRIVVENQGRDNVYVRSVRLNGSELGNRVIRHGDILAGGELRFIMDSKPYRKRKWKENVADMSTGRGAVELKSRIESESAGWAKEGDFQMVKARSFEYLCDHVAIDVPVQDYFPVFAFWTRHTYDTHPVWNLIHRRSKAIADAKYPGLDWGGDGWWMYLDFDHSAPDWDDALKTGFPGMEKRLLKNWKDDDFHRSRLIAIRGFRRLLDRLVAQGEKKSGAYSAACVDSLKRLAKGPPVTTLDALEFIYLYWIVSEHFEAVQVRTLGNLDRLLTPYYRGDLAAGRITEEGFRDMLRHFWWQWGSLDNYWGQPVYFGGTKADGTTEYNEVSRILMEVHDELALPTPKVHLKVGKSTPDWFWRQSLEMMRRQSSLTFIGEEPHWRVIRRYGYTEEQARNFLVWGCYEWALRDSANDTCGGEVNLVRPLSRMLEKPGEWKTFEEFRKEYLRRLVKTVVEARDGIYKLQTCLEDVNPSMMFTLATPHAVETGKDSFSGGMPHGNNTGIWMIGLGSAVDSLLAVKELVYGEGEEVTVKGDKVRKDDFTLGELGELMARNWEGHEELRLRMKRSKRKWGTDDPEANALAKEISKRIAEPVNGVPNSRGGFFKSCGHSARYHYAFGELLPATPDGRRKGEELSKNICPVMGADTEGATALIDSYSSLDPVDFPGDFPLDIALLPGSIKGEKGLSLMRSLIERYFANNGLVVQFNVVGAETLRDAQKHPEKYENLQVRVCGWNVRWNDIPKVEQDAFILRQEMLGN